LKALQPKHPAGLVVDLGCGSGILAADLVLSGYQVVGYDLSPAMVAIARKRVPTATFHAGSIWDVDLPSPCVAVAATGEIFNYLFDARNPNRRLQHLFARIHNALTPGGVLLFDIATPGRVPGGTRKTYTAHDDWACLYEATEDPRLRNLTRDITTFRRAGNMFRRSHEVHRLQLYESTEIVQKLRHVGFVVKRLNAYGGFSMPTGLRAFLARKK
jgi:SAM-dependent methyltransferase